MTSTDIIAIVAACLTASMVVGALIGYFMKQERRITTSESQVLQLSAMVEKNSTTVQNLAITMAGISEQLKLLLELKSGHRG